MDKYLLQILHDVNTIIIPGLGALTVTNAKTGEMMFMSYLKFDDGKLAAYISEKEGMSENDAKNLIAKYVREIQAKLDKGDSYDMFQFGRFLKNKDGDIDFESWGTYSSTETTESADAKIEEHFPIDEPADEVVSSEPEITEEIEIPVREEITPEEKPEKPEIPAEEVDQLHTEEMTVPEFTETAYPEDENKSGDEISDNLTVMPASTPSLDEILEKSEIEADENEGTIVQETYPDAKPDPIANQTQDESRVQVENVYIPPGETVPEPVVQEIAPEKPAPDLSKKKPDPTPEPKPKKKRGAGFWILIVLIILLVCGGTATVLFYDKVKTYLPFLESKRIEAEQKKDTAVSADELNENAAALEDAESGRVSGDNQPEEVTETPEPAEEPAVEEPAKPAEAAAVSNDGSKPYHLIGGAFGSKENADRYAAKNSGEVIGQFGGMHLVSIGSYASKQEASNEISGKAWIFKKP